MDGSSDDKKKSIPPWQRAQQVPQPSEASSEDSRHAAEPPKNGPNTPVEPAAGAEESINVTDLPESSPLKEQAARFLREPSIRDAPADRKREFLRSKGVDDEVIGELLDNAKAEDASADISLDAAKAWAKPSPPAQPASAPSRDIPPIVTYPEFLTQPTSPPPLITASRVLNTIYATAGLSALTYGLSTYLVQPMSEALTSARHDLASHTQTQLATLNEKLETMVSTLPPQGGHAKTPSTPLDDASSDTSDPTELYHRDFGTQTSPTVSRRPSAAAPTAPPPSATEAQHTRMSTLVNHLAMLNNMAKSNTTHAEFVNTQVGELKGYLNEMAYSSPYWGSDAYSTRYGGVGRDKRNDDVIEAVKADIRSVKGVLLSARNFPSGGRGVAR